MTRVFNGNLAVLRQRWPDVADAIENSEPLKSIELTQTKCPALMIDGIHLSSAYDVSREASLQARLVPESSTEATIYGVGTGDLIGEILSREAIEKLSVVVMNESVAKVSLETYRHHRWLSDSRVELSMVGPEDSIRSPFAIIPPMLKLASNAGKKLAEAIGIYMGQLQSDYHFKTGTDFDGIASAVEPFIAADGDVASLFGSQAGKLCVVVAGGPSTDTFYKRIQEQRDDICLIVLSTSYPVIRGYGLQPDVAVVVDKNEQTTSQLVLDGEDKPDTKLVYFPLVRTQTLEGWKGERLVAYSENETHFLSLAEKYPRGRLWVQATATLAAVDLAIKMGASRIGLLGADFAFPGGKTHANKVDYSIDATKPWVTQTVEGMQGEMLSTTLLLIDHMRSLEKHIARHPDVDFFNLSNLGAKIEGADYVDGRF